MLGTVLLTGWALVGSLLLGYVGTAFGAVGTMLFGGAFPVLAVIRGVAGLRRTGAWRRAVSTVAIVVGAAMLGLWIPVWVSMYGHDRLLARISDQFCSLAPPEGGTVVSCKAHIDHPFNGNQCGYVVDLVVRDPASRDSLTHYYASWSLNDVPLEYIPPPAAQIRRDGSAGVTLLFVGDEGSDLRCM